MIIYNKLKHMIDTKALRKENMSRNYGICPNVTTMYLHKKVQCTYCCFAKHFCCY